MRELIRQVLREALGVPSGSIESGEILYDLILKKLKVLPIDLDEDSTFNMRTNFSISDYKIKKVILNITFHKDNAIPDVHYYSMGFKSVSRYDPTRRPRLINIIQPNTIDVMINFAGPEDTQRKDLINYFKSDKTDIVSSLSHELGHAYNIYKKKFTSIGPQAEYNAYQKNSFPFYEIRQFMFNLYYIHSVENIVRPIEVASLMRSTDVKRENFYEFITNNKTYTKLKDIGNFSVDKMIESLKLESDKIRQFLDRIGVETDDLETDDELVNELLRIVYVNIANNKVDIAKQMMTTNAFEDLMGFIGGKEEFFHKLASGFVKYQERPIDFFRREERNFKTISEKMIKKISKLYDIAKVDTSSIKDWDLHHKINKTGEQFETEIKFKRKLR